MNPRKRSHKVISEVKRANLIWLMPIRHGASVSNAHFAQEPLRAIDLVHGPQHETAVDMDRPIALRNKGPVGNHPVERTVESKAHELTARIERCRTGIAVGDIHGGKEIDRQGAKIGRCVRAIVFRADSGDGFIGRVELALAGVFGEQPFGRRERRPYFAVAAAARTAGIPWRA